MKKLLNIFTILSITSTAIGVAASDNFSTQKENDQTVSATDIVDLTLSWQDTTLVELPNLVNALNTIQGNSHLTNATFSFKNMETNHSISFPISAFDAVALSFILSAPDFTFNRITLNINDVQPNSNFILAYYSFINKNGEWEDSVVVISRFDPSVHNMSEYWTTNIAFTYNVSYY